MQSADLTRPLFPLSEQERGELRTRITAAAAGCDIKVPTGERAAAMRAWWSGLSDEQRTCLKTAAGTRPVGPLTRQQRQEAAEAVKKAAETCDVRLPMRK